MEYQQCKKCVMDSTDSDISFVDGVCNHCFAYLKNEKLRQDDLVNFPKYLIKIVQDGGKYDCLIGLSGGVDSSLCLHYLVELGLKPLAFSFDNGWNDKRADENVKNLVKKLDIPHIVYTVDNDKYKELQSAFLMSGTSNIEIPTDAILSAITYELARKHKIKWIVSGGNLATENVMPKSFGYNANDLVFIKNIYKRFIGKKLRGLPLMGWWRFNYYKWVLRIKIFYLLDFI